MNSLDVGLAFVEGLALIASPCILPVLPLVLSTSIDGGKARPFGIIAGFVIAFSAFVLLSRQIVTALHVNTDTIRYVSLFLLALLGLVLFFDRLSESFSRMTQGAADFGSNFGTKNEGGFTSGLVIGALIGFVWTPCAGPILAAVLVQVIRQQTNVEGVLVTLGFALGAGIPMFIIALTGRSIMKRFSFFAQHSKAVRKIFAVLILASVAYMGLGSSAAALLENNYPVTEIQQKPITAGRVVAEAHLEKALDKPYPAPELTGIQTWLNSQPLTLASLKGKVVLIDFWTYSCINCVRTLPYVTTWDRLYRNQGLVVIGVHAPEFEFEKNIDNIKTALNRYGISYPVAVDNDLTTWVNYNNRYWPAHYLIDKNGQIVYTHFGEGDYDITENNIRYLLGLQGQNKQPIAATPGSPSTPGQTPETYLGFARSERFLATPMQQEQDKSVVYHAVNTLPEHHWSLNGLWRVEAQKITTTGSKALLRLNFTARKVFLVMGTADNQPRTVTLKLNGQALGNTAGKDVQDDTVVVNGHALYELVNQSTAQNGQLDIYAPSPGLEAYAFTFGN